jgi:predicted AlkP superfamily pyrophosphatase or phosphodiesterase
MRRRITVWRCALGLAAAVAGICAAASGAQAPARRTYLVIVVDGLRPDYITPELMPRLLRLGQRGVVFTAHHSVYPTVTRVNAAAMATGAYPETHGLLGNTVYIPGVQATRGLDTGSRANLDAIAQVEPRLLTAPSLGEILQRAGRKVLAVGAGTSGAALLLNHMVAGGAVLHHEFTLPPDFAAHVVDKLGPPPPGARPNAARNRRAVDAYLTLGLDEIGPDVTFMWISDPDTTAHELGIGTATTRAALSLVDAEIGRIEDTLASKALLDRTNLIVTSDHGFSTHTGTLKLAELVAPFARPMTDGSPDIVVAEGAVHFRSVPDAGRVAAIVAALQKRPEVGAIFTRAGPRGGAQGAVPGTLSFDAVRWRHPRSAPILVAANWTRDRNEAGYEGTSTQSGVAGHGTSSPHDIHIPLMAAGPDFRERAVSAAPTSNADLAPTLLRLLGLAIPREMTGRVIGEGLRGGPVPGSLRATRSTETSSTADGSYVVTAHFTTVAGHRYLDFTEVKRR